MNKKSKVWIAIVAGFVLFYIAFSNLVFLMNNGLLVVLRNISNPQIFQQQWGLSFVKPSLRSLFQFPIGWILGYKYQYVGLILLLQILEFIPGIILLKWGLGQLKIEE